MQRFFHNLWKKHRNRVGLAYFLSGIAIGLLVSTLMGSSSSASSTTLTFSSPSISSRVSTTSGTGGAGWNLVHVFYGDSSHIKFNSAISNDYFDTTRWYSQARQDEVVAALLRYKKNGYFIDLASNDPVKISNTYALETHYQWQGLCLEPNPMYWAGLSYRKCHVIGAVVGDTRMQEVHFKFPNRVGPKGGIVGAKFDNKEPSKFDEDRPRYTVPLIEIFQRFQTPSVIDYLSLDVEGAEDLVMRSFPFDKYRFNIITLERPSAALKTLLEKHGYQFLRLLKQNSGDTLWIHKTVVGKLDETAMCKIKTDVRYHEQPTAHVTPTGEDKDNYCEK